MNLLNFFCNKISTNCFRSSIRRKSFCCCRLPLLLHVGFDEEVDEQHKVADVHRSAHEHVQFRGPAVRGVHPLVDQIHRHRPYHHLHDLMVNFFFRYKKAPFAKIKTKLPMIKQHKCISILACIFRI